MIRRLALAAVAACLISGCAPKGQATPKAPAPGRYISVVSGFVQGVGPARQEVGTKSILTVGPLRGNEQHWAAKEEGGRPTETIRQYVRGGVYFVKIGNGIKGFVPNNPVLAIPSPANVGKTWSWEIASTDGVESAKSLFRVLKNETVDIGGSKVKCSVVQWDLRITGDLEVRLLRTIWYSPSTGLEVKVRTITDATVPSSEHMETTAILQSSTPS